MLHREIDISTNAPKCMKPLRTEPRPELTLTASWEFLLARKPHFLTPHLRPRRRCRPVAELVYELAHEPGRVTLLLESQSSGAGHE